MGFLATDIMLLHLVHWNDPNVRSYIYSMISATMSIFCAVLLNQAVSSFIIDQVLMGEGYRGFGIEDLKPWMHASVGACLFTAFFILLNVLCYKFRNQPKYLTGVEDIGAHITAFAGVKGFGWIQFWEVKETSGASAYGSFVLAVLVLAFFGWAASRVRWRWRISPGRVKTMRVAAAARRRDEEGYTRVAALLAGGEAPAIQENEIDADADSEVGTELQDEAEALEQEREWMDAVHKAENEAAAIILSFLASQAIAFAITGELTHIEGEEEKEPQGRLDWEDHRFTHIRRVFYSSLVTLVLLIVTTYCANRAESVTSATPSVLREHSSGKVEIGEKRSRLLNLWETFLAMLQSWTTMRVAYWMMRKIFHDKHQSQVATAGAVTFLAVVCIIILDKAADWINDKKADRRNAEVMMGGALPQGRRPSQQLQQPPEVAAALAQQQPPQRWRPEQLEGETSSQSSSEESSTDRAPGLFSRGSFQVSRESLIQLRRRMSSNLAAAQEIQTTLMDDTSLEKALRTVIVGLSLLVGLCWEKAFDAADEALVEGWEIARNHQVISKGVMAILNVAVVIPAWLKFMVPMAKMHWREHQAMMDLELVQSGETADLCAWISCRQRVEKTKTEEASHTNVKNFIHATKFLSTQELIDATTSTLKQRGNAAESLEKLKAALEKED